MLVMERKPDFSVPPRCDADRTDIEFHAPFGAFVPWRPLTQPIIPALEPDETREVGTEVPRTRPIPLGGFSRVPPRNLLTALSSPDQPLQPNTGIRALLELF